MQDTKVTQSIGEKRKLYILLVVGIFISFLFVIGAEPQENGWWIFKTHSWPFQYFAGSAFIIAAIYMFFLVHWYNCDVFSAKTSIIALFICGVISIFACSFLLYPFFYFVALREVHIESGWWIFKTTKIVHEYSNLLFGLLDETGAIAGIVEELAKFAALMIVPQVRRAIVDRRSGLYYGTLCAFGFALIENIQYFQTYQNVLILRANPAHAVFTSIWAAAYGSWVAKDFSFLKFFKYFTYGVCLHALWNICAYVNPILFLITFGGTLLLGLRFIKKELSIVVNC